MADVLQFSRETKVFVEIGSDIWEIPVMDGYSFSQATNSTEVVLNEMATAAGISRRGRRQFNDSVAPAEFSFSTYMRPIEGADGAAGLGAVEEALWACFFSKDAAYTSATNTWDKTIDKSVANTVTIDFDESNYTALQEFNLYFVLGACTDTSDITYTAGEGFTIYKIAGSVLNTATINFDIDGIAMIEWGGFGSIITEEAAFDTTGKIVEGIAATDNFIRNRLTSLSVATSAAMQTTGFESTYTVVLTGGSIEFNNNITFLTPETLCLVNQPLGHVTGTRTITGNFTSYLNADSATANTNANLWEDLQTYSSEVTTEFDVAFAIGGAGNTPRVTVNLDQCHFEIPTHQIDDVVSLDTAFHALPSTISETDEGTIEYFKTA